MTTDRVSASVIAIFALAVIWQSRQLPFGTFHRPGPAYVPVLLASLLLIFALCLLFTGRRAPPFASIQWTEWRHALAIITLLSFAGFAIDRLGYRLTVLVMLFFFVKVLEKRGWLSSVAFALALSFGSFYLFYTLLRVPLPLGPLGF